ncbi:NAD-binding protein [Aphanothece sacrum]|uniref:Potassium channel protein n=1 Tax=Aphanothece sacrum FPU1 TaxID=1920663 RepID=A0A401INT0_APHSA|nr:NAD-binding protein [Aphanothece sacrum]GBF82887.1 potassium channel protein [Aphanothece sacrum FPU1]GBF85979.1 potassium channel protein [Aphanothece sacrum FPU3]
MKPRIIVCGLGRTGYQIFSLLRRQGASVVGISDRPILGQEEPQIIVGELRSPVTLAKAGIHHAQTLVLASHDDAVNLGVLTQARLLNPHIRIINRLFNNTLGERLDQTLPDHVSMSVAALAAPIFSFAALGNKAIAPNISVVLRSHEAQFARSVQEVFDFETVLCPAELATPSFAAAALGGRILGNGITDDLLWVALATLITPNHPLCGQKLPQAAMNGNFVPLYLERQQQNIHSWDLLEIVLQSGDILYLTMPANELEKLWRTPSTDLFLNETSII